MGTELLDCFKSVRGFGNQLHVGVIGQKPDDPLTKNRMVVNRQDPDQIGTGIS